MQYDPLLEQKLDFSPSSKESPLGFAALSGKVDRGRWLEQSA
jgi:hypothetical protein